MSSIKYRHSCNHNYATAVTVATAPRHRSRAISPIRSRLVMAKKGKNQEYFVLKKEAEEFGVSKARPQDQDKSLMKSLLRKNLQLQGTSKEQPEGYTELVNNWSNEVTILDVEAIDTNEVPRKQNSIGVIDSCDVLTNSIDDMKANSLISVDFEFHVEHSFDGIIMMNTFSYANTILTVATVTSPYPS